MVAASIQLENNNMNNKNQENERVRNFKRVLVRHTNEIDESLPICESPCRFSSWKIDTIGSEIHFGVCLEKIVFPLSLRESPKT